MQKLTLHFLVRAKNIETVIVARFLQGAFGSTAATMVGGTIADIWLTKEYVFFFWNPYFVYHAKNLFFFLVIGGAYRWPFSP